MGILLQSSWTSVKSVAAAKSTPIKYVDIDGFYYVSTVYENFETVCVIQKAVGEEEKSADQLDFEATLV